MLRANRLLPTQLHSRPHRPLTFYIFVSPWFLLSTRTVQHSTNRLHLLVNRSYLPTYLGRPLELSRTCQAREGVFLKLKPDARCCPRHPSRSEERRVRT